jgi:hypothetical protein
VVVVRGGVGWGVSEHGSLSWDVYEPVGMEMITSARYMVLQQHMRGTRFRHRPQSRTPHSGPLPEHDPHRSSPAPAAHAVHASNQAAARNNPSAPVRKLHPPARAVGSSSTTTTAPAISHGPQLERAPMPRFGEGLLLFEM